MVKLYWQTNLCKKKVIDHNLVKKKLIPRSTLPPRLVTNHPSGSGHLTDLTARVTGHGQTELSWRRRIGPTDNRTEEFIKTVFKWTLEAPADGTTQTAHTPNRFSAKDAEMDAQTCTRRCSCMQCAFTWLSWWDGKPDKRNFNSNKYEGSLKEIYFFHHFLLSYLSQYLVVKLILSSLISISIIILILLLLLSLLLSSLLLLSLVLLIYDLII